MNRDVSCPTLCRLEREWIQRTTLGYSRLMIGRRFYLFLVNDTFPVNINPWTTKVHTLHSIHDLQPLNHSCPLTSFNPWPSTLEPPLMFTRSIQSMTFNPWTTTHVYSLHSIHDLQPLNHRSCLLAPFDTWPSTLETLMSTHFIQSMTFNLWTTAHVYSLHSIHDLQPLNHRPCLLAPLNPWPSTLESPLMFTRSIQYMTFNAWTTAHVHSLHNKSLTFNPDLQTLNF